MKCGDYAGWLPALVIPVGYGVLTTACGDGDDVWSGASGWIIGLLVGILLLSLILGVRRSRRR